MCRIGIYTMLYAIVMLFIACDNKNIAISDGNNNTKALNNLIENADAKDYEGLEHIFANNVNIDSDDRPIMLVFGKNNCAYCEKLKQYIRTHEDTSDLLIRNFKSYYINTSYSKDHHIGYLNKDMNTNDFARLYNLSGTPLVVLLESDGKKILSITGFSDDMFVAMIDFANNKKYKGIDSEEERMKLFSKTFLESRKKQS